MCVLCVCAGSQVRWKVAQLWKTRPGDPEEPQCSRGAARVALQTGEKREGQCDDDGGLMVRMMKIIIIMMIMVRTMLVMVMVMKVMMM